MARDKYSLTNVLERQAQRGVCHVCEACGEWFDAKVWHCDICRHHWQDVNTCKNCHKGRRIGSRTARKVKVLEFA